MTDSSDSCWGGSPPQKFKYQAFLSYSHQDARIAGWLHAALENYRIPKGIVGSENGDRPVPKQLFPIFRDREELPASADLSGAIRTAISQSACLVVVCSPAAAQSRWVNEEILAFKRLRPDRIFAVIARGEPNAADPAEECFPAALRSGIETGSEGPDQLPEPVAADVRPQADERDEAKLKLIAGILGLPLNDLKRRELIAARKRARVFQGIAAAMVLLTTLAVAGGWIAYKNQKKAERRLSQAMTIASGVVDRSVTLSEKYGVPMTAVATLLRWADRSFSDLAREELPDELKAQQANVQMLLSDYYAKAKDTETQLLAAQQAYRLLAPLVKRDPRNDHWRQGLAEIYDRLGQADMARGNLADALAAQNEGLAQAERLLAGRPTDLDRLRAVSVSLERIGTVLTLQGKLQEAFRAQERSLSIAERIAASRPLEVEAQRDLAESHEKIGGLLNSLREGDALASHLESLRIRRDLASQHPDDTGLLRELAVSDNTVGQLRLERNELDAALAAHREALALAQRLVDSDPGNAEWRHDLGATQLFLGDVLFAQQKREEAWTAYRTCLAIAEKLVAENPGNAVYNFALAGAYERIGDVDLATGNTADATDSYRKKLHIASRLAANDPESGEWNRDLLIAHVKVAQALAAERGDAREVTEHYRAALTIAEKMKSTGRLDPADSWMVRNLQKSADEWNSYGSSALIERSKR
jgi:eukaryotic-like serine/threonine-protein kinase